jgi:RecA-family ATPase
MITSQSTKNPEVQYQLGTGLPEFVIEPVIPPSLSQAYRQELTGFRFEPASRFLYEAAEPTTWVVDRLIPAKSTTLVVGDGGVRKSLLTQYIAVCLASGTDLFGVFRVPQRFRVLYIQTESSKAALVKRLTRLLNGYEIPHELVAHTLFMMSNIPLYVDKEDHAALFISTVIDKGDFDVLIFDPLADFHTGDENSAKDMIPVTRFFRDLRDKHAITSLILHHTNKNAFVKSGAKRVRGSTALWNSMDGRWHLQKGANSQWSELTEIYLKEHETAEPFKFASRHYEDEIVLELRPVDEKGATFDDGKARTNRDIDRELRKLPEFGVTEVEQVSGFKYRKAKRWIDSQIAQGRVEERGWVPNAKGNTKRKIYRFRMRSGVANA